MHARLLEPAYYAACAIATIATNTLRNLGLNPLLSWPVEVFVRDFWIARWLQSVRFLQLLRLLWFVGNHGLCTCWSNIFV